MGKNIEASILLWLAKFQVAAQKKDCVLTIYCVPNY